MKIVTITMLLGFALNSYGQQSGSRLPPVNRDELDDLGKKMYDVAVGPNSRSLAGLEGPFGIWIHSPALAQRERALNQYLRYESGISGPVRELAILVTAREMDSQFEWTAHEPVALKEGIDPATIDAVKYRKSIAGIPESNAVIIQLGREMFAQKKVAPDTFARALKQFGTRGLVNLVTLMSNYSSTAAVLRTFEVQLTPGQKPLLPLP
jgi:4-carboxymuconolactone decarboxylase